MPSKSRGPLNAFNLFKKDVRPVLQKNHLLKGTSANGIAKLTSTLWSGLPPEQKQDYENKAKEDKERFELELISSSQVHDGTPRHSTSSKRKHSSDGAGGRSTRSSTSVSSSVVSQLSNDGTKGESNAGYASFVSCESEHLTSAIVSGEFVRAELTMGLEIAMAARWRTMSREEKQLYVDIEQATCE